MRKLYATFLAVLLLTSCRNKEKEIDYVLNAVGAFSKQEYEKSIAFADTALTLDLDPLNMAVVYKMRGQSKWMLKDSIGACEDMQNAFIHKQGYKDDQERNFIMEHCR